MIQKFNINPAFSNFNFRLYISLMILGLCPTIYTTVRIFFIGQMPEEHAFSIAGQLSWINLLYEILQESIILPLFYFVGKVLSDKLEFSNRIRTGLLFSFGLYSVFSLMVSIFVKPFLVYMAADNTIINASATYIRIESVANVFSELYQFALVCLITLGERKYIYVLTLTDLILCILFDTFITSSLPCSINLGVNGIAITNIIVNSFLFVISLLCLYRDGISVFGKAKLSFSWMKEFYKVGFWSGLESFIRNMVYILMVSRMINIVGEQGTYWVANNFIWGWLLLPVLKLGELIKKDVAVDKNAMRDNWQVYLFVMLIIYLIWLITIPMWNPFMIHVLQFGCVDKLLKLTLILMGGYMFFAIQNIINSFLYGIGKTEYVLAASVITNVLYYGLAFIGYIYGFWTPTLIGIAIMFAVGMVFGCVVSIIICYKGLCQICISTQPPVSVY